MVGWLVFKSCGLLNAKLIYIYIYTLTHTHTHTYTYIYIYISATSKQQSLVNYYYAIGILGTSDGVMVSKVDLQIFCMGNSNLTGCSIHTALCHICANRLVNYYGLRILDTSGGVIVRLANFFGWVRFSLGAQFIRPSATSVQTA